MQRLFQDTKEKHRKKLYREKIMESRENEATSGFGLVSHQDSTEVPRQAVLLDLTVYNHDEFVAIRTQDPTLTHAGDPTKHDSNGKFCTVHDDNCTAWIKFETLDRSNVYRFMYAKFVFEADPKLTFGTRFEKVKTWYAYAFKDKEAKHINREIKFIKVDGVSLDDFLDKYKHNVTVAKFIE